jgi:hypothetical protein
LDSPQLPRKTRLGTSDIKNMQHWFSLLNALMADVSPANIYNVDETIHQIGRAIEPPLLVTATPGLPTSPNTKPRQWITAIECIAADGSTPGASIFVQDYKIDYNLTAVLDRRITHYASFINAQAGRFTEGLGLDWLKRFDHRTMYNVPYGQSRFLLFKAHPAFLTFECLQSCESRQIIPFFPPDITHLIQPLDVDHFQHYKNFELQHACLEQEKKYWFYNHFGAARKQSFTPQIIKHAFADRGIFPFNPSRLTQTLLEEMAFSSIF